MSDETTTIPSRATLQMRLVPLGIVLLAGVLIVLACYWKLQQPAGSVAGPEVRGLGLAPRFELFDQRGQMFRLERHLGRETVWLVFCGDLSSTQRDEGRLWLKSLVNRLQAAKAEGVVPVIISCEIPQESRKWASEFQLTHVTWLSDLDGQVHRLYGRWDQRNNHANTGIVQIDRRGKLPLTGRVPDSQDRLQPTS